jgi:hypothetical protein
MSRPCSVGMTPGKPTREQQSPAHLKPSACEADEALVTLAHRRLWCESCTPWWPRVIPLGAAGGGPEVGLAEIQGREREWPAPTRSSPIRRLPSPGIRYKVEAASGERLDPLTARAENIVNERGLVHKSRPADHTSLLVYNEEVAEMAVDHRLGGSVEIPIRGRCARLEGHASLHRGCSGSRPSASARITSRSVMMPGPGMETPGRREEPEVDGRDDLARQHRYMCRPVGSFWSGNIRSRFRSLDNPEEPNDSHCVNQQCQDRIRSQPFGSRRPHDDAADIHGGQRQAQRSQPGVRRTCCR